MEQTRTHGGDEAQDRDCARDTGEDRGHNRPVPRRRAAILAAAGLLMFGACAAVAGADGGGPAWSEREPEPHVVSEQAEFRVVEVVTGLSRPWGLAFLSEDRALVTERSGRLYLVEFAGAEVKRLGGLPQIATGGQGGLLDVAVDPEYEQNGWIYFTYSQSYDGGTGTTLARARLSGTELTELEELFRMQPPGSGGRHFGSRIAFLPDHTVVISIGDRGAQNRAQNFQDHAGSLVRLNRDGSVPDDNPFLGDPDVLDELYTLGNRNPQGLVLHPETGVLWQHEHGPRGGDELNRLSPGSNYGWPVATHGRDYSGARITPHRSLPGKEDPLHVWTPAIAPAGMSQYRGDLFPELAGDLLIAGLVARSVVRVHLDGTTVADTSRLFDDLDRRVRDVRVGPEGALYLLTDHADGELIRITPAGD